MKRDSVKIIKKKFGLRFGIIFAIFRVAHNRIVYAVLNNTYHLCPIVSKCVQLTLYYLSHLI